MKIKSALKQSIAGAWFAAVLSLGALAVAIAWPNGYSFVFLGFSLFYLVGDLVNVILIRRKAENDPAYLDEKIK